MTTDDTLDGKYRMGGLLGRGGMGAVHTATHLGTGRVVAIKVIRGGALDHTSLSRFARETRAVGALDTQHIVQVLDSGTDAETGTPYMVMEHLRGEDLRQLLDRVGALSPDVTLRIAAQVCLGLQKAHEAGVIHRDIKPANLYLARRDAGEVVVKILDFGVAKIVEVPGDQAEVTGLTNTGGMLGSPRYMSPEQVRAARNVDHRTDIWSLGVVLYRCLTGTPAYSASSSIIDLAMEICAAPPRPVQDVAPWIPAEVAALVHRTLQLAPEDRLADMGAMLDAIKPLLPGGWALREDMLVPLDAAVRAEVAPRFEHVPRADTTGSLAGAESTAKPSLAARALSRRTWALAAGAAVVAVVGALALRRPAAPRAAESAPSAPIAFSAAPREARDHAPQRGRRGRWGGDRGRGRERRDRGQPRERAPGQGVQREERDRGRCGGGRERRGPRQDGAPDSPGRAGEGAKDRRGVALTGHEPCTNSVCRRMPRLASAGARCSGCTLMVSPRVPAAQMIGIISAGGRHPLRDDPGHLEGQGLLVVASWQGKGCWSSQAGRARAARAPIRLNPS